MAPREQLQSLLEAIPGVTKVYFQPPTNVVMQYPCIRYERDRANTVYANDLPYGVTPQYEVILISKEPDTDIWSRLAGLPLCQHERFYVADNLNHDVFKIYF